MREGAILFVRFSSLTCIVLVVHQLLQQLRRRLPVSGQRHQALSDTLTGHLRGGARAAAVGQRGSNGERGRADRSQKVWRDGHKMRARGGAQTGPSHNPSAPGGSFAMGVQHAVWAPTPLEETRLGLVTIVFK